MGFGIRDFHRQVFCDLKRQAISAIGSSRRQGETVDMNPGVAFRSILLFTVLSYQES